MNCTELAATGLDLATVLIAGAIILGVGLLLIVVVHTRRGARTALLVAVALVAGIAWAPLDAQPVQAARVSCSADAPDSLTLAQTSVMEGLAPNTSAAPIAGRVTNVSADDTFITDVTVSIIGVVKAAGAVAGTCDASDYVIVEPVMDVNEALAGGASTTFAGASIGFVDKPSNQDACQGAAVRLLYTTG